MFKIIGDLWKHYYQYRLYVLLLFLAFLKQCFHTQQLVDTQEYLQAANALLQFGFPDSCIGNICEHWLHETRRTVGYPFVLMVFGQVPLLVIAIQCLLAVFVPIYAIQFLKKINAAANEKWLLWFFVLYPLQFFYANILMPEIWCELLVILAANYFIDKAYLKLGFALTFLLLLKPVFILLAFLSLILLFKSPLKKWPLIIPFIAIFCISIWNKSKTGYAHFSGIAVENAWEYNQRVVLQKLHSNNAIDSYYSKSNAVLINLNYEGKYKYMQKETRTVLLSNLPLYVMAHLKGSFLSMFDPGRYDFIAFFGIRNTTGFMDHKNEDGIWHKLKSQPWYLLLYMAIFAAIATIKWFLVLFFTLKKFKSIWPFLLVLTIFIGVTGPVGSARYLIPFMPVIIALAASGLQQFNLKKA